MAASQLFRHDSVIQRKDLLLNALVDASLRGIGIVDVVKEPSAYEERGVLRRLAGSERAECWTTLSIAAAEASLLRAVDRPNERDFFRAEALDAALASAPHLSEEQVQAVRFSTNRDGFSLCEAPAGTGKTILARALVDAAHRSGLTVLGLSPTWVGADELKKSCGIKALSIAKWRHDHLAGKAPEITAKGLIIVDEIGAASVKDMAYVARVAQAAQSKCICLGDRRQLESPSGGSVLRAVSDIVAREAVLSQIRRQEAAWQRAASIVMEKGDAEAGLRAYAQHDRVELVSGEAAAQDRVVQIWNDYRGVHGDDVLIITRRNADAAALNRLARAALGDQGSLTGPDVFVETIDRQGKVAQIELAQGDRIRFGENLPQHRIRNGNRGVIERIGPDAGSLRVAIRFEDGRLIEEQWASLVRPQRRRSPHPPRISLGYAGTAYSVQGRTSAASVLYIAKPTDAREVYVALTRHRLDARVVAERNRLEAAAQQRQLYGRIVPSETAIRERLFAEARSYAEKANVADYVQDRISFIRTGQIELSQDANSLNLGRVAQAVRRVVEATWQKAGERSLIVPFWRLLEGVRHMQLAIPERVVGVLRDVRKRIEMRPNDRSRSRGWHFER